VLAAISKSVIKAAAMGYEAIAKIIVRKTGS